MAVGGRGIGDVDVNEAELAELLDSETGPLARWMQTHIAEPITKEAKRLAPVSRAGHTYLLESFESDGALTLDEHHQPSGYMRSQIGWQMGRDADGMYWDIASPATTPDGAPYGLFVEVGTKAHQIEPHGDYPLRNRQTGAVFGRHVDHPGTQPQPYLRPAFDSVLLNLGR